MTALWGIVDALKRLDQSSLFGSFGEKTERMSFQANAS
jgi:hypothetical protein